MCGSGRAVHADRPFARGIAFRAHIAVVDHAGRSARSRAVALAGSGRAIRFGWCRFDGTFLNTQAALEQLDVALGDSARPGVVVLGPDGIGKSTLARLAAEHLVSRHPDTLVRWVTGTPTERVVPFGAFSHLVDFSGFGADIGKPAALLRAARASLGGDSPGGLLLVVDDAHDLDILSATLVYQFALAGTARMIVTARADAAPEAIAAMWSDGLLDRIDIEATGESRSPADVDDFIAELPAPARAVLDFLAVAEPLSVADLDDPGRRRRRRRGTGLGCGGNPGAWRGPGRRGGLHVPSAVRRTSACRAGRRRCPTTAHRVGQSTLPASVGPSQRPAAAGVSGVG